MARRLLKIFLHLMFTTNVMSKPKFSTQLPNDLLIGSASSAYQIEGAWNVDGKGPSIWDTFTHEHPDLIEDHSTGDDSAKSYYKYMDDIKALEEMGMQFYRFSISWPRIMPDGLCNAINQKGIDYYSNLIDELLKRNIQPMVTMYHWDLPQHLQDRGGWTNEDIIPFFLCYSKVLFDYLGDRVKWWITFNEPKMAVMGYESPDFAPGWNNCSGDCLYKSAHNILKAHAQCYHLYDKQYRTKQNGKVSITDNLMWAQPLNKNSKKDQQATENYMAAYNGWLMQPVYGKEGGYPQAMIDRIGRLSTEQGFSSSRLPTFTSEEIKQIRGTADFCALNIYTTVLITSPDKNTGPSYFNDMEAKVLTPDKWPQSSTAEWETISPKSIRNIFAWMTDNYGPQEFFITENGFSDEGQLDDTERQLYLGTYLIEIVKSIYLDNCKVIGYAVWSLIDNYEWGFGYTSKWGVYHVDFKDPERRRTPKQSSYLMKKITSTRNVPKEYEKPNRKLDVFQKSSKKTILLYKIFH